LGKLSFRPAVLVVAERLLLCIPQKAQEKLQFEEASTTKTGNVWFIKARLMLKILSLILSVLHESTGTIWGLFKDSIRRLLLFPMLKSYN
jgi:hypothetical protein